MILVFHEVAFSVTVRLGHHETVNLQPVFRDHRSGFADFKAMCVVNGELLGDAHGREVVDDRAENRVLYDTLAERLDVYFDASGVVATGRRGDNLVGRGVIGLDR